MAIMFQSMICLPSMKANGFFVIVWGKDTFKSLSKHFRDDFVKPGSEANRSIVYDALCF